MAIAVRRRATATTVANHVSSRTHGVLTITVGVARASSSHEEHAAGVTLSLVHLAGAESSQALGAPPELLLHRRYVNESLLALGRVLGAVPGTGFSNFRSCQLTRLLAGALRRGDTSPSD